MIFGEFSVVLCSSIRGVEITFCAVDSACLCAQAHSKRAVETRAHSNLFTISRSVVRHNKTGGI